MSNNMSCCCHGEHEHGHSHYGCHHDECGSNEKKLTIRIVISAVLFALAIAVDISIENTILPFALFVVSYIIVGYDVIWRSVKNILKGHIFDENLLMTIASIGAFLIGEHKEGVAVMLLYQLGEKLQDMAVDKSERSIESLLDVRPETANVMRNNKIECVSPEDVKIGEIIVIKSGEKVPLDGEVVKGETLIDTSAITGESVPVSVFEGKEVMAGCLNKGNAINVKVTKHYSDSAVSKILRFVKEAREKKPKTERFITRFAKYYTPIVTVLAFLTMVIPPLFDNFDFMKWVERGLVFLVVSCPCALVISVPLAFFAAMGAASKKGMLIKGGEYIEQISKIDTAVFDKTGTLTKGVFKVNEITDEKTLEYAAYCEYYSNHPIAKAVVSAYAKDIDASRITDYEEIAGLGVSAVIDNVKVLAGNAKLLDKYGVEHTESDAQVYVVCDGKCIGEIQISDEIKEDAFSLIKNLKRSGITTVMLTGDRRATAERTGEKLGIDIVKSELLPHEKAIELNKLNGVKSFVGDGINDAPVIAASNIGFAMGAMGSDTAVETADVVILTDEPSKVESAYRLSKRTMLVVKENIVFSISIKVIAMLLSILGVPNIMWFAIFADVGTAMIAIANSIRILYMK